MPLSDSSRSIAFFDASAALVSHQQEYQSLHASSIYEQRQQRHPLVESVRRQK
jgi:hypothetical protein